MKPPKTIKVGPHTRELHQGGKWLLALDDDKDGRFLTADGVYVLHPSLTGTPAAETSLHEVLHDAVAQTGFPIEDDREEQLVTGLAHVLLGVIRDNPDYVEWLCQ